MATGSATTIEALPDDVLLQILGRLDGPSLATASCVSTRLRLMSSHPDVWRDVCLSTWPSLRHPRLLLLIPSFSGSFRSFFSNAFPIPLQDQIRHRHRDSRPPGRLISAIDLYHKGTLLFSRVVETDTSTPQFQGSTFWIDVFNRMDPALIADAPISPEDLTVTWLVIDPAGPRRVANFSSRRQLRVASIWSKEEATQNWFHVETEVQFASAAVEGSMAVAGVTYEEGGMGEVRALSLSVRDIDGHLRDGRDYLTVIEALTMGEEAAAEDGE